MDRAVDWRWIIDRAAHAVQPELGLDGVSVTGDPDRVLVVDVAVTLSCAGNHDTGQIAVQVRRVRSPFLLADVLRGAGLPCLDVRATLPDDARRWLLKPLRGAAGRDLAKWSTAAANGSTASISLLPFASLAVKTPP